METFESLPTDPKNKGSKNNKINRKKEEEKTIQTSDKDGLTDKMTTLQPTSFFRGYKS